MNDDGSKQDIQIPSFIVRNSTILREGLVVSITQSHIIYPHPKLELWLGFTNSLSYEQAKSLQQLSDLQMNTEIHLLLQNCSKCTSQNECYNHYCPFSDDSTSKDL